MPAMQSWATLDGLLDALQAEKAVTRELRLRLAQIDALLDSEDPEAVAHVRELVRTA